MKFIEGKYLKISETLYLKEIKKEDSEELYRLMNRIYYPAYENYWKDDGNWYVEGLYNKENIDKELKETHADYFFVIFNGINIGILRTVKGLDPEYNADRSYIKLHRLYLDQTIQNQGLGKTIMNWLIDDASKKGYKKLWLEVMEKQPQAIHFYKKLGFIEVDKTLLDFPLLYEDYKGMYKMTKELQQEA
ncbi:MAG: GNAT family N-acetyltransferase [Flavobacteriaceae bacterium]